MPRVGTPPSTQVAEAIAVAGEATGHHHRRRQHAVEAACEFAAVDPRGRRRARTPRRGRARRAAWRERLAGGERTRRRHRALTRRNAVCENRIAPPSRSHRATWCRRISPEVEQPITYAFAKCRRSSAAAAGGRETRRRRKRPRTCARRRGRAAHRPTNPGHRCTGTRRPRQAKRRTTGSGNDLSMLVALIGPATGPACARVRPGLSARHAAQEPGPSLGPSLVADRAGGAYRATPPSATPCATASAPRATS